MEKVLLVSGSGMERGGVQMLYYNWVKYSPKDKYSYTWYFPQKMNYTDYEYAKEFEDLGVELICGNVDETTTKYKYITSLFTTIYNTIKLKNCDVIHVSTGSIITTAVPLLAARIAGVKKRIAYSANWFNETSRIEKLIRNMFRSIIKYAATSKSACSTKAAQYMFGSAAKTLIINPCTDCKKFIFNTESRRKIRSQYNIENKFVIGNMANFVTYKNHKFLIEIFNEVSKRDENAMLMLVGSGELETEIRDQISREGLADKVILCGNADKPEEYFCAMDVFVFPCISEGVGQVAIHAQNSGLHTICSDKVPRETNITHLVEYMSLSDSPRIWAEKILSYNNGYERENMYEEIKKANYDISSIPKYIEMLYE